MTTLSSFILGQMTGGSSGVHHLDFNRVGISKTDAALREAETTCQLAIQHFPHEVEASQELLCDAGAMTERDMEELQPGKCLGNHIVDFYIKYLERGLSPERRSRFYFFNSFFFTKLRQSTPASLNDPCEVDYEQIRSWTKEVNLFKKDYVLIPIIERSHWSLVIICNLSSLTRAAGETMRFPCIVHLDPLEGQHESFEDLMRSYVWEAWMDSDQDRHQLRGLRKMEYIQAEVPKQDNSHDCGLFVLHYIESFLMESTSPDFSFASSERGPHFSRRHFAAEVSSKRRQIQNLILQLQGISQKREEIKDLVQEFTQTSRKLRACFEDEGKLKARIQDLLIVGPTIFNGHGCEINHASVVEDTMYAQYHQSNGILRGNNEPFSGPQSEPMEYENRCESLSPKQQHAEPEVQTVGLITVNSPIFETKNVSTQEATINVEHQQSSKIFKLDHEPLDGLEHPHPEYQRATTMYPDQLEEVPCMDLSEVRKGENKRGWCMADAETWELLSCKLKGGRFYNESRGGTNWEVISEEIEKKHGSKRSPLQCRRRYETLRKAYKSYKNTGKEFSAISEAERLALRLATSLSQEWYTILDKICDQGNISQKRMKLSSTVCKDLHRLSSPDLLAPNPPPTSLGRPFKDEAVPLDSGCGPVAVALRDVVPATVLSSLDEDLQSTLLNLVQECFYTERVYFGNFISMVVVCQRLAIVQDCEARDILNYVSKLWQLELVQVEGMVFEEGKDLAHIDLLKGKTWDLKLGVYEKISKEVLCKNPHLNTYCKSFPIEQSSLRYIRVLRLSNCYELQHLNLREFPRLRSLSVEYCPNFHSVAGWEAATGLLTLEIWLCPIYYDFPDVRKLFSLREIVVNREASNELMIPMQMSDFTRCAQLWRLEITGERSSEMDLENLKGLKFLAVLALKGCAFSSIRGLSGLQALTTLQLQGCTSLRSVSELGCLKGLTDLDMMGSGIEDLVGVEGLHLLTSLGLFGCESLKCLPFLGHLTTLVSLDLRWTSVKEIPGREALINLKNLEW